MSHIAVLKGGRSLERQVSLKSGIRVEESLVRLGHQVTGIDVGHQLVNELAELNPEIAFIALHGGDGEDGTVQELLEILGFPYTGSRPAACRRTADKIAAKYAMRDAGIPTPSFYACDSTAFKELGAGAALPTIISHLSFPLVVKPSNQGSALGIKFAETSEDVPAALVSAFSYDDEILFERHIAGRELAVSVLDDGGEPAALPVVEAIPERESYYDFESRYEIGKTRFVCPAELDPALAARANELALKTYRLLGCGSFARVDLMLEDDTGELYVLEANTIPGLTDTSLLPLAADAAGIPFDRLIERIVAGAQR
jgi:D-alanine-D-alanine ligase